MGVYHETLSTPVFKLSGTRILVTPPKNLYALMCVTAAQLKRIDGSKRAHYPFKPLNAANEFHRAFNSILC